MDGVTWRPLARATGETCIDCGRHAGAPGEASGPLALDLPWFAGDMVVCNGCFKDRVRADVRRREIALRGRRQHPFARRQPAGGDPVD